MTGQIESLSSPIDIKVEYLDYVFSNEEPSQNGVIESAIVRQRDLIEEVIGEDRTPAVFFVGSLIWRGAEYIHTSFEQLGELQKKMAFVQMDITPQTLEISSTLLDLLNGNTTLMDIIEPDKTFHEYYRLSKIITNQDKILQAIDRYDNCRAFEDIDLLTWHNNFVEPHNHEETLKIFESRGIVPVIIDTSNMMEGLYLLDENMQNLATQSLSQIVSMGDTRIIHNESVGNDSRNWNYLQREYSL